MGKISALMLVHIEKIEQEIVNIYGEEDGSERRESAINTHYDTPSVPGMGVNVLGMNPNDPNGQQLWLVTTTQPVVVALSGEENFEWLTADMAQNHINDWNLATKIAEIVESHIPPVIEPHV